MTLSKIESVHDKYIKSRRVKVLCSMIACHLNDEQNNAIQVLDIGCGDGALAKALMTSIPSISIVGIDPLVRDDALIPVTRFNGLHIPFEDNSFDYCLFVDVLHHSDDPNILLSEAARVSRKGIVIKDHTVRGLFARQTLKFMDDIHNKRYGVSLPYSYWTPEEWDEGFARAKLSVVSRQERLALYPLWANWWFGRGLHFIAQLAPKGRDLT